MARRYDEAAEALRHIAALTDHVPLIYDGLLGGVLILQGHADAARSLCAPAANLEEKEVLAIADQKLGHQADAEANLARLRAEQGDAGAFSYAEIYAQWGRKAEAMTWLGTAARLHDPGVAEIAIDPDARPGARGSGVQADTRAGRGVQHALSAPSYGPQGQTLLRAARPGDSAVVRAPASSSRANWMPAFRTGVRGGGER